MKDMKKFAHNVVMLESGGRFAFQALFLDLGGASLLARVHAFMISVK
jgi:hypothetical protein